MDFEDDPGQQPLHVHERRYVLAPPDMEGEMFRNVEVTLLDGNGMPRTIQHHQVFQGGCGHFIGFADPAEVTGVCSVCEKTLCHRCGHVRCHSCLRLLCPDHAFAFLNGIYCGSCRRWAFAKAASVLSLKAGAKLTVITAITMKSVLVGFFRFAIWFLGGVIRLIEKG